MTAQASRLLSEAIESIPVDREDGGGVAQSVYMLLSLFSMNGRAEDVVSVSEHIIEHRLKGVDIDFGALAEAFIVSEVEEEVIEGVIVDPAD